MPKQVVESPRPMSESGLWGLLVDFYRERGPDAWRSGKVPQRMTSNGYLADVYSSVAGAFAGWCLPHLMRIVEEGEPFDRKILHESLLEAYRCELPEALGEESLDTRIAFLFMTAKMYEETVQLLTMSMPETGRSAERLYLLAVAMKRLGREEEACRLLFELLEGDPGYWTAMPGAEGTPSEVVEWLLSAEEDALHLDHIVLRPSVAEFSRLDASEQPA